MIVVVLEVEDECINRRLILVVCDPRSLLVESDDSFLERLDYLCHLLDRSIVLHDNGNEFWVLKNVETCLSFVGPRVEFIFQ